MERAQESYQKGLSALQKGDFYAAEQFFIEATQIEPDGFNHWNLLGVTYQLQKSWSKCYASWKQALHCKPDCIDTKLNLGIACIASSRPKEAEEVWLDILMTNPKHVQSLINLGLFYRERARNQMAHDMWQRAFDEMPDNAKVQEWLADVKGVLGMVAVASRKFDEAALLLKRAVMLDPEYAVLWGYLSELHFQKKEFKEAFATCSKALNIEPNNSNFHHTMGNILRMTGQDTEALKAYEKSRELGSRHPATYRAIAELKGEQIDENEDVIQQLFDQYAEDFDTELQGSLSYATPSRAYEVYAQYKAGVADSILDLGCGTGLSLLPFLSPESKTMSVGVDISSKMLDQAREKNIYSELHCASLRSFIQREHRRFGLVLCLDALVYLRNLEDIFVQSHTITQRGGHFVFSTEASDYTEPLLQSTGRYAHPRAYIQSILNKQHWCVVACQKTQLRKDGDHWIDGDIWVIQAI